MCGQRCIVSVIDYHGNCFVSLIIELELWGHKELIGQLTPAVVMVASYVGPNKVEKGHNSPGTDKDHH